MKNYKMNFIELQVTISLCFVFFLRMLGVFSVLPVLSKYGAYLDGSNKFLIGVSIGIYGVSQIIFQIPFGILSDKFGKKYLIIFGLFMFFIGSTIPVIINSIWGLIIGRMIQGTGAISGVSMALLSDLIKKENRIKAISAIGISFACSFLIAIVSSPLIAQNFSFSSIFFISSIISIICIAIILINIPNTYHQTIYTKLNFFQIKTIKYIFSISFFKFYINVFWLHFLLTMQFLIIPHQLEVSGIIFNYHWIVYFTTILISFLILFIINSYFKKQALSINIIKICILLFLFSSIIFYFLNDNLVFLILSLQIFFISFNILEIVLPASLSQKISFKYKGSVMSVYSTSQFLGISCSGILSGWLHSFLNVSDFFLIQICFIFLWLIFNLFCEK